MSLSGLGDKVTRTTELKVYLPEDLDTRFRKAAMSSFGYGRGSLSKAAAEALDKWCSERETNGTPLGTSLPTSNRVSALKDAAQVNDESSGKNNIKGSVRPAT